VLFVFTKYNGKPRGFAYFSLGRHYMKEVVKNLLSKRKQEENKEEKLFIDSILDCDLMDEEEVT